MHIPVGRLVRHLNVLGGGRARGERARGRGARGQGAGGQLGDPDVTVRLGARLGVAGCPHLLGLLLLLQLLLILLAVQLTSMRLWRGKKRREKKVNEVSVGLEEKREGKNCKFNVLETSNLRSKSITEL